MTYKLRFTGDPVKFCLANLLGVFLSFPTFGFAVIIMLWWNIAFIVSSIEITTKE